LELGIRGEYNGLSAIMVPILCDSLKGMGTNWEYGVKTVPVINVAHAQNRKCKAGVTFTASQYRKIASQLSALSGRAITDEAVLQGIELCNANRKALRRFIAAAGAHPELVSPAQRCAVIKCGYFMDAPAHTALVEQISDALERAPSQSWNGLRIVTTGILADAPDLLAALEENHIAVVDDQVLQESISFREDVPADRDPYEAMALRMSAVEGCSVLFDPGKKRASMLVELAQKAKADGVLFVLTKFCDPEEYDFVPVKQALTQAGIPALQVEIDQQMTNYEQVRSALQAFAEMHS
jgi:benzoyl-CoA reductase/2-hydroxyglutaryl-CoA dehydratase subunit BcrC/BadD/HgdB